MKDLLALVGLGTIAFIGYGYFQANNRRQLALEAERQRLHDLFKRRTAICLN